MKKLPDNIRDVKHITLIDHFLTDRECRSILFELDHTYWTPSKVINGEGHHDNLVSTVSDARVSQTAYQEWFSDTLLKKLCRIEDRLEKEYQTAVQNLEPWQATNYTRGGKFDFHLDCGSWKGSASGERKRTILLYLNTPEKGGETCFRALNISIPAVAGRLLIWDNLLPAGNCNHAMIHSGSPVIKGQKSVLVTWEREFKHKTI